MIWTNKTPTEEGWYWLKFSGSAPHIVDVWEETYAWFCGEGVEIYVDADVLWAGPIPEPGASLPISDEDDRIVDELVAERYPSLNAPEPLPKPNDSTPVWDLVLADMQERDRVGREKYGTPLQAFNGRNPEIDAYQEVLDLVVYMRQGMEERKRLVKLLRVAATNLIYNLSPEKHAAEGRHIEKVLREMGEL